MNLRVVWRGGLIIPGELPESTVAHQSRLWVADTTAAVKARTTS